MEDLTQRLMGDQNQLLLVILKIDLEMQKGRECVQSVNRLDFSVLYMWLLLPTKWSKRKKQNNSSDSDIS